MGLYHKDVFLPSRVRKSVPTGLKRVVYTRHAKQAALNDRYGRIELPSVLDLGSLDIIEVEHYTNGGFAKAVLRQTGQEKNTVFVIVRSGGDVVVKTVWTNLASDKHTTLNPAPYEKRL